MGSLLPSCEIRTVGDRHHERVAAGLPEVVPHDALVAAIVAAQRILHLKQKHKHGNFGSFKLIDL